MHKLFTNTIEMTSRYTYLDYYIANRWEVAEAVLGYFILIVIHLKLKSLGLVMVVLVLRRYLTFQQLKKNSYRSLSYKKRQNDWKGRYDRPRQPPMLRVSPVN